MAKGAYRHDEEETVFSGFQGAGSVGGDPRGRHDSGVIEPLWDSPEHDLQMEASGGGRGQGELCFRALEGRWLDNVFIERLWRSLKQECVYLNAFDSMRDATGQIGRWIAYYNRERPHSSLGGRTPFEAYMQPLLKQAA